MGVKLSTGFRNIVCQIAPLSYLLDGGTIYLYGGTPPNTPDLAPGTPILGQITTNGLAFMPSNDMTAAGLRVEWRSPGSIVKAGNWVMRGVANGTATWFRWCWRQYDDHADSSYYPRLDGTVCGVLRMSNPNITTVRVVSIDSFILVLPVGN